MADLDVAVRLKFLTSGEGELKAAAKDIAAFGKSLNQLSGKATGRFAADLDKATRASQRLQATLGKSAKSASQLAGRATARFGYDLNKAWGATTKLGGALDKSARAAGKTASAMRAIGQTSGVDRARASVDRLTKSTNALASAGKKVKAGALGAVRGSGDAGGVLAAGAIGGAVAGRRKAAVREGFAEAASRLSPGAGYLIGAGGAVMAGAAVGTTVAAGLAIAARSTKEAIDRNKSMAEVQKKVNLDVGDSWEAMERRIGGVSRKIGISYGEAASAFAQGGQGNVAARNLEAFALLGAKISAAWDVGAKEAAQTLTEVKAQTGWTVGQLQEFGDKVNFLGDISAGAERDIASMFSRTASAAKAAGVGFDESLVAMTALRSVGMEDSVASRFFGQFTAKLRTATHQSKDAQATFKELGLSAEAIEKGMQTKPMETMMGFIDRLAKSKDPVKHAMAFGGQQWFDETLKFKEAAPELIRLWEAFRKGGFKGSLDKAMETDLNTIDSKMKRFWQGLLDTGAEQFKGTAAFIDKALDWGLRSQERVLKWAEDKRLLDKAGKGEQLSPDEAKRVANDPDLRAKIDARKRALKGSGESLADYQKRLGLDRFDPTIADRDGVNKALPHAEKMGDISRFDPNNIWQSPEKRKKGAKGKKDRAPIPTFANEAAQRPAAALLDPKPTPLPKHPPLPPRRPQQVSPTDRAPVVGGSVPAFASGSGVTPHVDAAPIERLKSIAEGAKQVLEGLDVKVTPNVDATSVVSVKGKSEETKKALEGLNLSVSPVVNSGSLDAALAKANALNGVLRSIGSAGAPGATRRVNPTLTGAPRGGGGSSGGGSTGGGSAPTTPGKQARHGRSQNVHIATAHFHGVRDPRAMRRQLAALDRRIRNARDNALHDIG